MSSDKIKVQFSSELSKYRVNGLKENNLKPYNEPKQEVILAVGYDPSVRSRSKFNILYWICFFIIVITMFLCFQILTENQLNDDPTQTTSKPQTTNHTIKIQKSQVVIHMKLNPPTTINGELANKTGSPWIKTTGRFQTIPTAQTTTTFPPTIKPIRSFRSTLIRKTEMFTPTRKTWSTKPTTQFISLETTQTSSPTDSSPTDSSATDSTPTDSSPTDSSPTDSTPTDSFPTDSSPKDSSATDSTATDSSPTDSSSTDSSSTDSSSTDSTQSTTQTETMHVSTGKITFTPTSTRSTDITTESVNNHATTFSYNFHEEKDSTVTDTTGSTLTPSISQTSEEKLKINQTTGTPTIPPFTTDKIKNQKSSSTNDQTDRAPNFHHFSQSTKPPAVSNQINLDKISKSPILSMVSKLKINPVTPPIPSPSSSPNDPNVKIIEKPILTILQVKKLALPSSPTSASSPCRLTSLRCRIQTFLKERMKPKSLPTEVKTMKLKKNFYDGILERHLKNYRKEGF